MFSLQVKMCYKHGHIQSMQFIYVSNLKLFMFGFSLIFYNSLTLKKMRVPQNGGPLKPHLFNTWAKSQCA